MDQTKADIEREGRKLLGDFVNGTPAAVSAVGVVVAFEAV
jgi:hypothetical protein